MWNGNNRWRQVLQNVREKGEMGMKLSQLVSTLNSIIERSNRSLEDIEVVIDTKEPVMTFGARPCTEVKSVSMGFDWEAGQLRITPENDLMCVKHNYLQNMRNGNRLELIECYKKQLVESTNIKSSPNEMAVIDNILFRFWQMGWLKEQNNCENCAMAIEDRQLIIRCKDCKYWRQGCCDCDDMWRLLDGEITEVNNIETDSDFYCGYAEKR